MKTVFRSPTTSDKPRTARPRPRSSVFVRLARIALWLIIGIIVLAVIGATYQIIATELDQRAYPPPGQRVDVGGYQMHLYCTGTNVDGSSTVILESGLGSISSSWALVQAEVAKGTRVCSYDRAGMGWSDSSSEPPAEGASLKEHMAYKLRTAIGTAIYRLSKSTVEPVIGIIKEVLGFRQFSLRGLFAAGGEWTLVCIAYNLKRLHILHVG